MQVLQSKKNGFVVYTDFLFLTEQLNQDRSSVLRMNWWHKSNLQPTLGICSHGNVQVPKIPIAIKKKNKFLLRFPETATEDGRLRCIPEKEEGLPKKYRIRKVEKVTLVCQFQCLCKVQIILEKGKKKRNFLLAI